MKIGINAGKAAAIFLGLFGIAGTAQAANNPLVVWQGSMTITSLSAGCDALSYTTHQMLPSIFRPRLESDEPASEISVLSARSTQAFINVGANDQMNGGGSYAGVRISTRATTVPNASTGFFPGTYKFKIKPSVITATTGVITITGQLTNFYDTTGCTMGFVGAYVPRGD